DAAQRRPLLDDAAKDRPEIWEKRKLMGRERALIYKTLVLTGLRKGELASLTVVQLSLDGPVAYANLRAADEKNREGSEIPIRADLADDLRQWLADKLDRLQAEAIEKREPSPARLPACIRVFKVPTKLYASLNRDLKLAGIAKKDDRGRVLDVHALRTTFGTLLSKGGVNPRTAQSAMRHSTIDLTMNVYTDPRLLDIHGAVEALPALPLGSGQSTLPNVAKATGTDDLTPSTLAPVLAPTPDLSSDSGSISDKMNTAQRGFADLAEIVLSAGNVKRSAVLTTP